MRGCPEWLCPAQRYNDETGSAPLTSGYSEVVFGELFRAADFRREDAIVPRRLAVAFVFDHPSLASVLVGATAPAQLDEVVAGVALHAELSNDDRARLRGLAG